MALTSRANWVKGTKLGVAGRYLVRIMESVGLNRNRRAVDAQRPSFSAQGTGVRAFEVLKYAVSIGDEVGRHLGPMSDRVIERRTTRTGGDFSKRVIFH